MKVATTKILVVDDDDHVRDALVDELSRTYTVEAVSSGGEAFEAISGAQYDVIISDLKMPDHDGIEVLEFARRHQGDAVRVLLTGYLDERARDALMAPDAPYKVGKPWHDEIEVVVRRGLEHRDLARQLSASVEDALALTTFDEEVVATRTPLELADTVVRRALVIEGVMACGTVAISSEGEHVFTGGSVPAQGPGWYVDLPLDAEGNLRLRARGHGESARQLVSYMAHRAQRSCGILEARGLSLHTVVGHGTRVNQLMRQATLGALTSALLHDLASTMQAMSAALDDATMLCEERDPSLPSVLAEASSAGEEVVQLFVQMRKFIRAGEVHLRQVQAGRLVERAVKLANGYITSRARLDIGKVPDIEIPVSEALFLQVLSNLLRNAANASPASGTIDLVVTTTKTEVIFTVTDDGPGVAPEIANHMFEPFASTTTEGTGLGLAISAYVMQMHGGRISYRRDPQRGASFQVALPLRVD